MPTKDDKIVKKGRVKMNMLSNLGLQDIQIRLLLAEMMYNYYLSNEIMDVSVLDKSRLILQTDIKIYIVNGYIIKYR